MLNIYILGMDPTCWVKPPAPSEALCDFPPDGVELIAYSVYMTFRPNKVLKQKEWPLT